MSELHGNILINADVRCKRTKDKYVIVDYSYSTTSKHVYWLTDERGRLITTVRLYRDYWLNAELVGAIYED